MRLTNCGPQVTEAEITAFERRWWRAGAVLLLPALHGCATQTPARAAPSLLLTLPGVVAEIGTLKAAVLIFRTLIGDIHRESEQRKRPARTGHLPLSGRWLQYLIACLVTAVATPFIFALLLGASIAVAWALMLLFPGLRFPPLGP